MLLGVFSLKLKKMFELKSLQAQRVDYLGSNDPTQKGQTKVSNMYVGLAAVGIAAGLVAVYLGYKYYKANS